MGESFSFYASCICLAAGILLLSLPANRYWRVVAVGAMGPLFLVCGVVLMTTFKWTEVAIKLSDLEVKLSRANADLFNANMRLASVKQVLTPAVQTESLTAVLAKYEQLSNTVPSKEQVRDFRAALDAANVKVVPYDVFNEAGAAPAPLKKY
jgi:hypothetical protein